jgi:hypothetical protein
MSDKKLAIKLSTLEAIGDAVREKESSTEPIPVNALADRITALPTPSGENKFNQLVEGTLTELTAEDLAGITKIRYNAFFVCRSLISVTIGNSVTSIGANAFSQCNNLMSVIIGNNVINIDASVFDSCPKLTNITIGSGITEIKNYALRCGSTTDKATITFLRATPPTVAPYTFRKDYLNKIIVPAGSGEAYKAATNWANYADFIEEAAE